ncbi:MJ1255/VC2487 family glycosyltransferase [Pseudoalteromonas sp. S16_S37]|uniref:MJ1255/VC2487 family glycosyltransferase n=1 Tax=Pseudoalteromonas sp. S16_S37 TaxID=2720228 RepID=UPI001680C8D5|nr:MJ1255/VC2487 family glycosyltransferase [Pseudoalteromonas sp. S16_S37]MBD1584594.1 glycosyltransferase [Pseudoalteromonas sp. S16_S37]
MKILYGVQGTGNGHTTRARIMAECFARLGVEVDYLFSGRPRDKYFDMEAFGDYQSCEGLSFSTQSGQINKLDTLKKLKLGQLYKDVRHLDVSSYNLIFNDFEPITAWAGKLAKVPVIAMSHQASFLFPEVPVEGAGFLKRKLLKSFAPANIHLGVHWQPFAKNIIPPFIPYQVPDKLCQSVTNKVLVYLPFEELSKIIELLQDFPDKEFYCYHPDAQNQSLSNIHLRAPSRDGFLKDLANTSGIVANAGFELSSEAMKFGKKLLLKPLSGQFEQLSNALTLENMGRAKVMHYLSSNALEEFLESPMVDAVDFPSDPTPLVEWLVSGHWFDIEKLHHQLWQSVNYKMLKAA